MAKKILPVILAFVSPQGAAPFSVSLKEYDMPDEKVYNAIHTNEAGIVYVNRDLKKHGYDGLAKVFLARSSEVLKRISFEVDANPPDTLTHYEFLLKRLAKEDTALAERAEPIEYKITDDITTTLQGIFDIANTIRGYANENPGYTVRIYIDLTGGHRYSAMMMLAVVQLLQEYDNIEMGEVRYSDMYHKPKGRVHDATDLASIFKMVSGTDEFVNFGSIKSLEDYLDIAGGTNISEEVSNLFMAMTDVSDALQICRTGEIRQNLQNLSQALGAFRARHGTSLAENMIASVAGVIEGDCKNIIAPDATEMDIIQWCIQKRLFQQAMTLYTEWIPQIIVKNGIFYTENEDVIKTCEEEGKKLDRTWEKQFVISHNEAGTSSATEWEVVMEQKDKMTATNVFPPELKKRAMKAWNEYKQSRRIYQEFLQSDGSTRAVAAFAKACPHTYRVLVNAYKGEIQIDDPRYLTIHTYAQMTDYDALERKIIKLPMGQVRMYLGFSTSEWKRLQRALRHPQEDLEKEWDTQEEECEENWKKRKKECENMLTRRKAKTRVSKKTMEETLKAYHSIRFWRNQVNHATEKAKIRNSDIKRMIQEGMDITKKAIEEAKE